MAQKEGPTLALVQVGKKGMYQECKEVPTLADTFAD